MLDEKSDVHRVVLERAKRLSKSNSKVFNQKLLRTSEKSLMAEGRNLGLSNDDMKEILKSLKHPVQPKLLLTRFSSG